MPLARVIGSRSSTPIPSWPACDRRLGEVLVEGNLTAFLPSVPTPAPGLSLRPLRRDRVFVARAGRLVCLCSVGQHHITTVVKWCQPFSAKKVWESFLSPIGTPESAQPRGFWIEKKRQDVCLFFLGTPLSHAPYRNRKQNTHRMAGASLQYTAVANDPL